MGLRDAFRNSPTELEKQVVGMMAAAEVMMSATLGSPEIEKKKSDVRGWAGAYSAGIDNHRWEDLTVFYQYWSESMEELNALLEPHS